MKLIRQLRRIKLGCRVFIQNLTLMLRLVYGILQNFILLSLQAKLIVLKTNLRLGLAVKDYVNIGLEMSSTLDHEDTASLYRVRKTLIREAVLKDLEGDTPSAQDKFKAVEDLSSVALKLAPGHQKIFGFIGSEITSSIGHTALCLSLRQMANELSGNTLRFYITADSQANPHYLSYWEKYFPKLGIDSNLSPVIEREMWPFFENVSSLNFRGKSYSLYEAHNSIIREWEQSGKGPLLVLSDEDKLHGNRFLASRSQSFKEGGQFVALHVRSSNHFALGLMNGSSYGRNAHIQSYLKSIRFLIDSGYTVVRIGEPHAEDLPAIAGLYDYANDPLREPRLDTYFLAECEFLLGTNSGPICVPPTFGKRVIMTNAPSLGRTSYFPNSLMVPKLVADSDGQVLTFKEMLVDGSAWSDGWPVSKSNNRLFWRDNDEDEILNAVKELIISDHILPSRLREQFEVLISSYGSPATANISESFLSKWQQLLS